MVVLFGYQEFLQWRYPNLYGPKARPSSVASTNGAVEATPSGNQAQSAAQATPALGNAATSSAGAIVKAPERTITVDTDYYSATLTSYGARLLSFKLKKYRETGAANSPPYEMIRPGDRMPLGLFVMQGNQTIDDADVEYSTDAPAQIACKRQPDYGGIQGSDQRRTQARKEVYF